jgi:hypothetical protein
MRAPCWALHLFAYRAATGEILPFAPQPDAPVLTPATGANNTVYAGGAFQKIAGGTQRGVAQLNLADGSRVPAFTAAINWADVRSLISYGPWLYAAGSFSRIGTTERIGLARLNATSGGVDTTFDTAARFDLRGTGMHRPLWVNWTGGDSLYSVADTGSAVYVGGHQRWMDNPQGHETAGPGAVERPGIAAINPITGKATPWNAKRIPRAWAPAPCSPRRRACWSARTPSASATSTTPGSPCCPCSCF